MAFEHTLLKESGIELKESGLIVQALKPLGPERITLEVIPKIRAWLPESLRSKVLVDTKTATAWVYSALQQITQPRACYGEESGTRRARNASSDKCINPVSNTYRYRYRIDRYRYRH